MLLKLDKKKVKRLNHLLQLNEDCFAVKTFFNVSTRTVLKFFTFITFKKDLLRLIKKYYILTKNKTLK